jgi:hypothetical protein
MAYAEIARGKAATAFGRTVHDPELQQMAIPQNARHTCRPERVYGDPRRHFDGLLQERQVKASCWWSVGEHSIPVFYEDEQLPVSKVGHIHL